MEEIGKVLRFRKEQREEIIEILQNNGMKADRPNGYGHSFQGVSPLYYSQVFDGKEGELAILNNIGHSDLYGYLIITPAELTPPFLTEEDARGTVYKIPSLPNKGGFDIHRYLRQNKCNMTNDGNGTGFIASFSHEKDRNGEAVIMLGPMLGNIAFTLNSPSIDSLFREYGVVQSH